MFFNTSSICAEILSVIELEWEKVNARAGGTGYYIICQWNDATVITEAAHFYAVKESLGQLIPYNGAGNYNSSLPKQYPDFASMLSHNNGGSFIYGYKIG